jgi:uncharacterized membrane protein YphA (DoxX/SURF4 family)
MTLRFRADADVGLLLFRLATGLSLFFTFGLQKVLDGLAYTHTGHWSFVDFNVKIGLPLPVVVAVVETLNESVGALLVAAGLWTRYAGLTLVVGFAAATTCSLIVGEFAWRFAATYCLLGAAVVAGGPGRYSVDALRQKGGRA